MNIMIFIGQSG